MARKGENAALINGDVLDRLLDSYRKGLKATPEYRAQLESDTRERVRRHVESNASHGTIRADVFLGIPASPRRAR